MLIELTPQLTPQLTTPLTGDPTATVVPISEEKSEKLKHRVTTKDNIGCVGCCAALVTTVCCCVVVPGLISFAITGHFEPFYGV